MLPILLIVVSNFGGIIKIKINDAKESIQIISSLSYLRIYIYFNLFYHRITKIISNYEKEYGRY